MNPDKEQKTSYVDGFHRNTLMMHLPDDFLDSCDGEVYEAIQELGYDQSIRSYINQGEQWDRTIGEVYENLCDCIRQIP